MVFMKYKCGVAVSTSVIRNFTSNTCMAPGKLSRSAKNSKAARSSIARVPCEGGSGSGAAPSAPDAVETIAKRGYRLVAEVMDEAALAIARRTSEVIAIDSRKLRELCESDRELGFSLMTEIAQARSHRLEGARVQLATRA